MTRISTFAGIVLVLFFCIPPLSAAQDYEIHLTGKAKSGDRYRAATNARHLEKIMVSIGDKVVKMNSDEFTIELVSLNTVLETNPSGKVAKAAIAIEKCLITVGGIKKPLIDAGVVVIAAIESQTPVFEIDGKRVDQMTAKALGAAITLDIGGFSDDDIFGTRERKRVGDSWEVNRDLASQSLKETVNAIIAKEDVKGTATLDGVVKLGPEEHLVISGALAIDKFAVPLPQGLKVQDGQLRGKFSGKYPVKRTAVPLGESARIIMWFTASGAPDPQMPEMTVQGVVERSVTTEFAPAK